jgi:hypothetical protein
MSEFFERRKHKAKKPYTAHCCGGPIQIGEVYDKETGVFDGMFFESRVHLKCLDAFEYVREGSDEDHLAEGDMAEKVIEYFKNSNEYIDCSGEYDKKTYERMTWDEFYEAALDFVLKEKAGVV